MSILSRHDAPGVVAALAIAAVIAACSSAASVAPAVSPSAAVNQGSPAAASASSTGQGAMLTLPPGTPMLVDPFISVGIATTVDVAAHAVDPSTYRTTIPGKDYTSVYVVFALKPDAVGNVSMVMTFQDAEVADKLTIDYGTINSWGDFKINFSADGIPPGIYKAVMTYEPTGAQVVQYFAVT